MVVDASTLAFLLKKLPENQRVRLSQLAEKYQTTPEKYLEFLLVNYCRREGETLVDYAVRTIYTDYEIERCLGKKPGFRQVSPPDNCIRV